MGVAGARLEEDCRSAVSVAVNVFCRGHPHEVLRRTAILVSAFTQGHVFGQCCD